MPVSVLIVDDNRIVRTGLRGLLEASPEIHVVGEAWDGQQAVELARSLQPDVTLLDVQMPHRDGVSAAGEVARHSRVLMMTFTDDPAVVRDAVAAGAQGYLVHGAFDADDLVASVLAVSRGSGIFSSAALSALTRPDPRAAEPAGPSQRAAPSAPSSAAAPEPAPWESLGLSERQAEIMRLIAGGLTNGEIAARCFLSEKTVKNHINRIFAALGVRSRAEAVSLWFGGQLQASDQQGAR
jgi:DNA-binding NarL/FixJ family response regulator